MTFNSGSQLDPDRVQRRGPGRGAAVGGGIGALLVALFAALTGTGTLDLSSFTDQDQSTTAQAASTCLTGADANQSAECRYVATVESLDSYWAQTLPAQTGVRYTEPGAVSFSGSTSSPCGTASAATGPFYCPSDQTVFLDVGFFDQLTSQYGSSGGPLAQEYVVAHEVGHHIQDLTGVLDRSGGQQAGAGEGSVRTELMADCLGGMWARGAATTLDSSGTTFLEPLTEQDIADALSAAAAVGDDRIQEHLQGRVDPESWTHGSAEQRQRWFTTGFRGTATDPSAVCDTFKAGTV